MSRNQFEKLAGLGIGFIRRQKEKMHPSTVAKIQAAFPDLSLDWLLNDKGPMLVDPSSVAVSVVNSPNSNQVVNSSGVTIGRSCDSEDCSVLQSVPCVPSGIYQRRDLDCLDFVKSNPVPRIRLSSSFGVIDLLYTVRDDSMLPAFNRGDIIGLREVPIDSVIVNGNVYLIDSCSCGLLLRMVYDLGDGSIEVAPMETGRYRSFKLEKSDVIRAFTAIYLVRPYL